MTVTINNTGARSRQVVISGEVSATGIITAVNTALTALGWTLYDTATSGAKGMLTTKVYSASCVDATTTKYMILRFDVPKGLWYVSCAEYWNTVTQVATNEVSLSKSRMFPMPLQYSNCTFYIFATARYACFMASLNGEYSLWQGVFEYEREADEDTAAAGIPCFGWTSSVTIGESYSGQTTAASTTWGPSPVVFAVPRNKSGQTGWAATKSFVISTSFGAYPPPADVAGVGFNSGGGITAAFNSHNGMLGAFGGSLSYLWDLGKKVISNLKLTGVSSAYPTGRIFGLKVIPPTGNIMDSVTLPMDLDGFYSPTGVSATNVLLGISGGYSDTSGVATGRLSNTLSTTTVAARASVVLFGNVLYRIATSVSTIYKMNTVSGLETPCANALPGTAIDLVWDGGNYLYISTSVGLTRMALDTEALTNLTLAGGYCSLAIDDAYVYAAQGTLSLTPKMDIIDQTSFTVVRTHTSALSTATTCRFSGIYTFDYTGVAYTSNVACGTAANVRAWKIRGSDGVGSYSTATVAVASCTNISSYYDGSQWNLFSNMSGQAASVIVINPADLSIAAALANYGAYSLTGQCDSSHILPAFRGAVHVVNTNMAHSFATPLGNGYASNTAPTSISIGTNLLGSGAIFMAGSPAQSDGVSMYASGSATYTSKISGWYQPKNNAGSSSANIVISL